MRKKMELRDLLICFDYIKSFSYDKEFRAELVI